MSGHEKVAQRLIDALRANLFQNGRYQVLQPEYLETFLQENGWTFEEVAKNPSTIRHIPTVDAVVIGFITGYESDKYKVPLITFKLPEVKVRIRLIDFAEGRVVESEEIKGKFLPNMEEIPYKGKLIPIKEAISIWRRLSFSFLKPKITELIVDFLGRQLGNHGCCSKVKKANLAFTGKSEE